MGLALRKPIRCSQPGSSLRRPGLQDKTSRSPASSGVSAVHDDRRSAHYLMREVLRAWGRRFRPPSRSGAADGVSPSSCCHLALPRSTPTRSGRTAPRARGSTRWQTSPAGRAVCGRSCSARSMSKTWLGLTKPWVTAHSFNIPADLRRKEAADASRCRMSTPPERQALDFAQRRAVQGSSSG